MQRIRRQQMETTQENDMTNRAYMMKDPANDLRAFNRRGFHKGVMWSLLAAFSLVLSGCCAPFHDVGMSEAEVKTFAAGLTCRELSKQVKRLNEMDSDEPFFVESKNMFINEMKLKGCFAR